MIIGILLGRSHVRRFEHKGIIVSYTLDKDTDIRDVSATHDYMIEVADKLVGLEELTHVTYPIKLNSMYFTARGINIPIIYKGGNIEIDYKRFPKR